MAKYMAVSQSAIEKIWISQFLNKFLLKNMVREMKMLSNNETSIILKKISRTKINQNISRSCITIYAD